VNLKLLIDIQGQVKSIEVAKSSGFSALDDAALNSLKLCKFTPANIDGKAAERWTNMSYTFKME
jgi:protein TonB